MNWKLFSFVIFAVVFFASSICADEANFDRTYTLFASGDTSLARWVPYAVASRGYAGAMNDVKSLVEGADIAMTNLECVVSTKGDFADKGEKRPFLYRARPELLDVLTHVGFDVAVVANNHSGDYGPEAFLEELEFLEAAGIAQVGGGKNMAEAQTPTYVQTGNVIVAFIGMETNFVKFAATDARAGNNYAREYTPLYEKMKGIINEAKKYADIVVFTPHWGDNWTDRPTEKRRVLAHALIDYGVDAVLGHSSHLFHGVEVYKGKPIVYDMGSFFFDTVAKKRMRLSAGFILEFDKTGFLKLLIRPLYLGYATTSLAKGRPLDQIKTLMKEFTKELTPGLKILDKGDKLIIDLHPEPKQTGDRGVPSKLHQTGSTKRLPAALRNRRTNVVYDQPPNWTKGFVAVELNNGIKIIGARNAEAVYPRRAFFADVALKVPKGITNGRWEANIKGVQRDGDGQFFWRHPIADGAWIPHLWRKGEIVVDHTLVRPPKVEKGTWDLFWRFEQVKSGEIAHPKNPADGDTDGFVRIGRIKITRNGIPEGPAGVAWSGILPKNEIMGENNFNEKIEKNSTGIRQSWLLLGFGMAFMAGGGIIWLRRKKSKA